MSNERIADAIYELARSVDRLANEVSGLQKLRVELDIALKQPPSAGLPPGGGG